jgi:AhpD family alkylhydroperoxidase
MGIAITKSEMFREVESAFGRVPEWMRDVPESAAGFWILFRDFYLAETKIPSKYKELIGLGVSGATRCRYCALFHTEAARLHGATDEEIAEASMMAGVTMCASTFLNAQQADYEKFSEETRDIVAFVKNQAAQPSKKGAQAPAQHARS